jgi:hypothetical protein
MVKGETHMKAFLTEVKSSQLEGCRSEGSSYPESEKRYFKRVYGSDHLDQLHDGHQEEAILRYVKPERRKEVIRRLRRLGQLTCSNASNIAPGRSAYSLKLLRDNLAQYKRTQVRSLRWNQHYQKALQSVAEDVKKLLPCRATLKPMSIQAVAASEPIQRNLDKNAGYYAFETEKRSKGENLQEAVEWCSSNLALIAEKGDYGLPVVMSHRSSNSKPISDKQWKWKCRIILMQDLRALLLDGRFAVPFTTLFKDIPWGEGSMNQEDVRRWVSVSRAHYPRYYSSDYSSFDVSQAPWLLEDVMLKVVRPLFGDLSEEDEQLFNAMVHSYIHKEIHSFDGVIECYGCQLSGALTTYAYNTIVNEIVDRTSLLMQGCDLRAFTSLKCGDDNLTFYLKSQPWDREKHCYLISHFFGIKTTLEESDCGESRYSDPTFLSRTWSENGEYRNIDEVLWNLVYPERFRDYSEKKTGCKERRAEALVFLCAVEEQSATMREYFDIAKVYEDAQIKRGHIMDAYKALESMGSGFRTPWINFKFGNLKTKQLR